MRKLAELFFKVLVGIAIAIVIGLVILGPTDSDGATRTLQNAGYTNIQITGPRPLMRGQDDVFSTGFEATGPTGQRVSGAVTGGWFKGSTIRFD